MSVKSWLRALRSVVQAPQNRRKSRPAAPAKSQRLCRPLLEALEQRTLMTVQGVSLAYPTLISDTTGFAAGLASISDDGRYVAFTSDALNVVAGQTDTNGASDVFLHDRVVGTTTLVSRTGASATTAGNGASTTPVISGDGRYVAFLSTATNLITGQTDTNTANDVFLYDREAGTTVLVSRTSASATTAADAVSGAPVVLSSDGLYVVYSSNATNLVAGQTDTAGTTDVFLFNRATGATVLVSRTSTSATTTGNAASSTASMSTDGRYVAFTSNATDLVTGQFDVPNSNDVFLFDRVTSTTTLVSHASTSVTTTANGASGTSTISGDGRFVAYRSAATNLVTGQTDTNAATDVFLFERETGATTLVSHTSASLTTTGNAASDVPVFSRDGSFVAFRSVATNVVAGMTDTNGTADVFLYNRATEGIALVSRTGTTVVTTGNNLSEAAALSTDGRYVAFRSAATNLVTGQADTNNGFDIFLFDRVTGATALVSHSNTSASATGDTGSLVPTISADGRYVGFLSAAANLVNGRTDISGVAPVDVFLYDRDTTANRVVTLREASLPILAAGGSSTALASRPAVSDDGRYIAYASRATNLVDGQTDTNNLSDVFLYDRVTGATVLVSHTSDSASTTGNAESTSPVISSDGRYVAFQSFANNLVAGTDANNQVDVFLYDRDTGVTTLVSRRSGSATATGNGLSDTPVMSSDGRYVVFRSAATNLVAAQTDANNTFDVFLFDRDTGVTTLVSRTSASATTAGDAVSGAAVISADGNYVAFSSNATNLVPGQTDTNATSDVFLFDRSAGTTALVSRTSASATTTGDAISGAAAISGNGSYVAFISNATNLVAGQTDTNTVADVFLFDRVAGTTTLVSRTSTSATTTGDAVSGGPVTISADGGHVAFSSNATNLVADQVDTVNTSDVFLFFRVAGANALVSHTSAVASDTGDGASFAAVISGDGRYVAFSSNASNLVVGQIETALTTDVFRYDRVTGTIDLVSHSSASLTAAGNFASTNAAITNDGRYVAFTSGASTLIAGDHNREVDVFLFTSAKTVTWSGAGGDDNWQNGANWQGGVAPAAGDRLVFPADAARLANTNDFPAGTTFLTITLSGAGYALSGNPLTLTVGLTDSSGSANTVAMDIAFGGAQVLDTVTGTLLTLSGALSGGAPLTKVGGGQVDITGSLGASLVTVAAGTFHTVNTATVGTFVNAGGTAAVAGTGSLAVGGTYLQTGVATLLGGGMISAAQVSLRRGVLNGSGTIVGNLINAATINIGGVGATGVLAIMGDYTQTADGVLNIEIGGPEAITQYDVLMITGSATLDGTLNLILINDYVPPSDATFLPISSEGTRTGAFATITGLMFSPFQAFLPTYFDNGLMLSVFDV